MTKKILAFLITFIMMFSVCSASYAAVSEESEQLFIRMGIFNKFNRGIFSGTYSRGEFTKTLCNIISDDLSVTSSENFASDIADNKYKDYINYVLALKLMSTDENGKFNPNGALTENAVIRSMIILLEYDALVQQKDGRDEDYLFVAISIGLTKGVSIEDKNNLSQEETAEIVKNALEIRPMVRGNEKVSNGNKPTLLEKRGITKLKGTVLANDRIGMETKKAGKGYVNIEGEELYTAVDIPNEAVGTRINYYVKDNAYTDEPTVIFVYQKNYDAVTIFANEIDNVSFGSSYIEIEYNDTESAKLSYKSYCWVNGKSMSASRQLFNAFKSGSITLLSADGGVYDRVHMELAKTVVVDGVYAEKPSIIAKYSGEIIDMEDLDNDKLKIFLGKKETDIKAIGENCVISIFCDSFNIVEGEIIYDFSNAEEVVIRLGSTLNGEIESVHDSDGLVMIDDVEYEYSDYYRWLTEGADEQKGKADVGDNCTFLLDCYGQIVDYLSESIVGNMEYGYLIKGAYDTKGISGVLMLKILCENGRIEIYNAAPKLTLDGQSGVKSEGVILNGVDLSKKQLIRYKLVNGLVKEIDTAAVNSPMESKDTSLSPDVVLTSNLYYASSFDYHVAVSADTKIFVDHSEEGKEPQDRDFEVITKGGLMQKDYNGTCYNVDEMNVADCLLIIDQSLSGSFERLTAGYIVEKINNSINKDGLEGYTLNLYGNNTKRELFASGSDVNLFTAVVDGAGNATLTRVDGSKLLQTISPGDVVRIKENSFNEITYIERIFDFNPNEKIATAGSFFNDLLIDMCPANLYKANSTTLAVNVLDESQQDNITPNQIYVVSPSKTSKTIPVYDISRGKVEMVSDYRLLPSYKNGNSAKCFVRFSYESVVDIFVYQY